MITARIKHEGGFTLIELMVAVSIFGFLAIGVIALVSTVLVGSDESGRDLANIDEARKVAFGFTTGLRSAAYSETGGYPLQVADAQNLIFFTNTDGDEEVERIRYYVSGNVLMRGVIDPSGSPAMYDPGDEQSFVVVRDLANNGSPVFLYFDDTYEGEGLGSPLSFPVNITEIRYIQISLLLSKSHNPKSMGTYEVSAGASVRNLKTNLGE